MRDDVERRRIHSHAELAEEAIKDLPRIRDALNNETATDTFFAPSNEAIQSFAAWEGTPISKRASRRCFQTTKSKRSSSRTTPCRMNVSIGGSSARRLRRVNFFRRLSRESLRIHPRRWK